MTTARRAITSKGIRWGTLRERLATAVREPGFWVNVALRVVAAAGLATMLHLLLEVNEYYGDLILGTHNVRGIMDSMNDLSYGLLGVLVYTIIAKRNMFLRLRQRDPGKRVSGSGTASRPDLGGSAPAV